MIPEPRRHTALKSALVLVAALLLQLSLVSDLHLLGAVGDMLLLVTIASGLVDGPDRGATMGFAAGLLYDLVLDTPFALSALTYALVGFAVGMLGEVVPRTRGRWTVGVTVLASVAAMALYMAVGHLVGTPYPLGELPAIALVVAAWNAVLVLPVRALLQRLSGRREPDRIRLAFR